MNESPVSQPGFLLSAVMVDQAAKLLTRDEARRIAANIAKKIPPDGAEISLLCVDLAIGCF